MGIVCGNLISGRSQRRVEHEHSRLAELTLAFDAMKKELERLPLKVDRLEKDLEAATLDLDQTRARYRAALDWGHKLRRIIEDLLLTLPKGDDASARPGPSKRDHARHLTNKQAPATGSKTFQWPGLFYCTHHVPIQGGYHCNCNDWWESVEVTGHVSNLSCSAHI